MVRSLADRTFQLRHGLRGVPAPRPGRDGPGGRRRELPRGLRAGRGLARRAEGLELRLRRAGGEARVPESGRLGLSAAANVQRAYLAHTYPGYRRMMRREELKFCYD